MAISTHKYAPWRRVILVPFWTIQLGLMLGFTALLALAVGVLTQYDSNADYNLANDAEVDTAVHKAKNIYGPIWIALAVFCAILIITEIILLTRRKLTPLKFVIVNVIKTTIWTALCIMDIVAWAKAGRSTSYGAIFLEIGIVLSFWIPLVYGSIIYFKTRRTAKSYQPISHPLSTPAGTHDTSYPSHVNRDLEGSSVVGNPPAYYGQVSGTTTGGAASAPSYDSYNKPGQSYGDVGLAHQNRGIPQVYVQQHDVYEMDSRRNFS